MKISIDFTDRAYAAACWVNGGCISGYFHNNPWRTEWHTPLGPNKTAKHFATQVDAWESMHGPVEEIAIQRDFHPLCGRTGIMTHNFPKLEQWAAEVRAALWDTAMTMGPTISVAFEESHRRQAAATRLRLGFNRGPLLTRAIMVGMTADYDSKRGVMISNKAVVTARRAAENTVVELLKKKNSTLSDMEDAIAGLVGFTMTIGEDERHLIQNITLIRGLLRDWTDIKKVNQSELIAAFEKRVKALEDAKKS